MKLRRRYRIALLALAGLVVLWLIYYAGISVVYGLKLRSLRAQVEAEGSSLDLVKLAYQRAGTVELPVHRGRSVGRRATEAKENAAFLYRAAGLLMDRRSGSSEIPGIDAYDAFLMAKPGERVKVVTEKRQGLEAWLRDSAIPLQLLHQAAQYEHAWFDVDYSEGGRMKLPHLAQLRDGARLLMLEAWLAAEQGDAQKALQATWCAFRLRRATEDEPLLISQLVGIVTDTMALSILQGITPLIEPQGREMRLILKELQSRTANSFRRGAEGERALIIGHMESARKHGFRYVLSKEMWTPEKASILEDLLARVLNGPLPDETFSLAILNRFVRDASRLDSLPVADIQSWEGDLQEVFRAGHSSGRKYFRELSWRLLPTTDRYLGDAKKQLARYAVAQCGVAAELYRLDRASYPASLEALVPTYLGELPHDTFSGKPLLFKSLTNGVLIYSVGPDGKDDGGVDDQPWIMWSTYRPKSPADDVVWRVERPAAPAKNP